MFGEIVAYSLGKAVARRRYNKRSNNQEIRYCYGCAGELNRSTLECYNIEDFCIDCCNCTEHTD